MNYHSVGKELGENPEAKIMFSEQSPTSAKSLVEDKI